MVAYMTVDEWMIGYLLSFGVQVEVIEPISLQKEIAKRALQIYDDIVNITLHFFLKDVRPMQHPVMNHSTAVA